jgi:DNA-binding NarL/FixJ family response regulator
MIRIVVLMETEQDRRYFETLLQTRSGLKVMGMGKDGYDAIQLSKNHQPDIALVDENLPLFERGRIISAMLFWSRETRIIMITANPEGTGLTVLQAISAGAAGYFSKSSNMDAILGGIGTVMQGGCMMPPELIALAYRTFPGSMMDWREMYAKGRAEPLWISRMSRQELRLLTCIGRGLSNAEISAALELRTGTIRNYLSAIYSKTGMRSRTEVALFAKQMGFAGPEQDGRGA